MSHIGGAQQIVHQLAESFLKDQHDVKVLTASNATYKGNYPVKELPALSRTISWLSDLRTIRAIRQELKTKPPNVLSVHSTKAAYLGRLAAIGLRIPIVYTVHGLSYYDCSSRVVRPFLYILEAAMSKFTTHYIFLSNRDASKWKRFAAKNADVIPNGVQQYEVNTSLDFQQNPAIVWVGRLSPPKNPEKLLADLATLTHLPWHLHMIGEGNLKGVLQQQIEFLNLADRITLYGEIQDPTAFYQLASMVVLASRAEGIPLTVLEAMSQRKPVIASDVGALAEVVQHGTTGYLVEHSFTPYIERLLKQPRKARAMGEAGFDRYQQLFSYAKMYESTAALFKRIEARR